MRGGSVLSKEGGLIIALARRAALRGGKGMGAFDQTLFDAAAAGIVPPHTYRNIAHACIRHSARATVQAMDRYQGRANHERHVPSMGLLFRPSFWSTHKVYW